MASLSCEEPAPRVAEASSNELRVVEPSAEPHVAEASSDEPRVVELSEMPSAEVFWRDHVQASVPLVVRGGVRDWEALKWSADYFRQWPEETVRVAPLQAHGPHAFWDKWLEPAAQWQHAEPSPDVVRDELLHPRHRLQQHLQKAG